MAPASLRFWMTARERGVGFLNDVMSDKSMTNGVLGNRDLDYEKDSLHIMPLLMVPLETTALKHARMIKNVHFDSMIEVFKDEESGSGQIEPSKLGRLFDWPPGQKHPDGVLIAKLSLLQSFDIYSLRIQLRSLGIEVEDNAHLRLSESKRAELDVYMRDFTRPLMDLIYTDGDEMGLAGVGDIVKLFRGQDNAQAIQNLNRLSQKLKIFLSKIPDFLADYGDVFLSLAYFKNQFEVIAPRIDRFLRKVQELKQDTMICGDLQTGETLDFVETGLYETMSHIADRIQSFDRHTAKMWENLNMKSFRKVKVMIESNHSTIGGMLCGLNIKMNGYEENFGEHCPSNQAVADYIAAYVKPGIDRIKYIERSSRLNEAR